MSDEPGAAGPAWNRNEGKFDKPSSGVPKAQDGAAPPAAEDPPAKPKRAPRKASAKEQIAAAAAAPVDMPDLRQPIADDGAGYDIAPLGDDCPVQPLGFYGQRNYFLDHAHQLIELGTEFRKGECMQLFGVKLHWLKNKWPTWKVVKDKRTGAEEFQITGFDQKLAQEGLIMACSQRGLFDPTGKVRGRGAHVGDDASLHLHCGDGVMIGGQRGVRGQVKPVSFQRPGLVAGYVYPAFEKLDRPDDVAAPTHVGEQVLQILRTWNWRRPTIDPYLMLCWIAAAPIGGALRWRPHCWITGPSGAGKTSLQKLIEQLLGSWAIRTEDATEAGVRQLLSQDTLAVCFDEIEPDEGDGTAHQKIVKLARLASSGGSALRGSQDHKSKQFVAKSCFLFSSIHHHELAAQDRNRIAILHLSAFPSGTPPLVLPETLAQWGRQLRRRMLEQWTRFDATLLAYQAEMLRQGHNPREQDQYGTLLAAGDMLLYDKVPPTPMEATMNDEPDRCQLMVRELAKVLDAQRTEGEDVTTRCIHALTSYRLPAKGGQAQETIGQWLSRALGEAFNTTNDEAQRKLMSHGLKLVALDSNHTDGNGQGGLKRPTCSSSDSVRMFTEASGLYVLVAGKLHRGALEIFGDTMWKGGIWMQSLAAVPFAFPNKKARFGDSPPTQCIAVPLIELIDVEATVKRIADDRSLDVR